MTEYVLSGAIPAGDLGGLAILDVGCADGYRYALPEFEKAQRLAGIDPDERAVLAGKAKGYELQIGKAETLPFKDGEFGLYMSIVSLPYTDVPKALSEAFRVLAGGGRLHVTMHDWQLQRGWLWTAVKGLAIKRVIDHVYIAANSFCLAVAGKCFARPWKKGSYESFQTRRSMGSLVRKAGFTNIEIRRTHRHFVVEARKP